MSEAEYLQAFDHYHGQIYGFVLLRVGKQREIAEDITAEAYVKAWRMRDKFDRNRASLKTWLFVIARNLIIDYYRANARSASSNLDYVQDEVASTSSADSELVVLWDSVWKHAQKLEQEDQELLALRYVEQLELEEIAAIVGKNYNATKVAVHRALQKLKQLINN